MFGDLLQPVDGREHRQQRKRHARRIEPAGVRVSIFRQQRRPEQEQQRHHRHRHQEHRAPGIDLQERTTHQRADHCPGREAGDPHADGELALVLVVEHVADQGHGGRRQRRAGDAEQCPHRDQHLCTVRPGRDQRSGGERRRAGEQQLAAADAVAERAHRDQEAGHQEAVDVDDPQQLRCGRFQLGADGRQRQVEHREVHRVDHARQREHAQADPLAAGGLDGRCDRGLHGVSCRPLGWPWALRRRNHRRRSWLSSDPRRAQAVAGHAEYLGPRRRTRFNASRPHFSCNTFARSPDMFTHCNRNWGSSTRNRRAMARPCNEARS